MHILSKIYFLISYSHFDYTALINMNIDDFDVFYDLAQQQRKAEEDEIEKQKHEMDRLKNKR